MTRHPRTWRLGTVAVAAGSLVAASVAAMPAGAAPAQAGCDTRTNNTTAKLLECVRVEGVVEHLEALQAIADANGGNRASTTPGYDASVDYVVRDPRGGRVDRRGAAVHVRRGRRVAHPAHADRRAASPPSTRSAPARATSRAPSSPSTSCSAATA